MIFFNLIIIEDVFVIPNKLIDDILFKILIKIRFKLFIKIKS